MSNTAGQSRISQDLLDLLEIALSSLPIDHLRDFVALMETTGSEPHPAQSRLLTRRALAVRLRPRRYGWRPRKSLRCVD